MIVDRENGKALVEITVSEGPQYRVGLFTAEGNKRFSTEEVLRFYPFNDYTRPITSRITSGLGLTADPTPKGVFDKERWDESFTTFRPPTGTRGTSRLICVR